MGTQDLIELYSVPEIFVDGFARHTSHDGVMTCIGYRLMDGHKIVVLRLVWPAVNTTAAINEAVDAMSASSQPKRDVH